MGNDRIIKRIKNMINKIKENIEKYKLLKANDKVVVAVSGGPDSVVLLHVLKSLQPIYDLTLRICHLNHQLRGEDAEDDATFVKALGHQLDIETFVFSRDVVKYSNDHKMSFEEAARTLRYYYFEKVMKDTDSNCLAVGQNKNDQVETFFLRAFRGAGLEGLTAIKHKRQHVIRPLLGISRDEIEAYILNNNLKYRTDKTNNEVVYARNKIRHELIPYIKDNFNERIIDQIYRSVQLLQEDLSFIESSVEKLYQGLDLKMPRYEISLKSLADLHESLKSRLLRKIIDDFLGSLKGLSFSHIEDILCLLSKGEHGKNIYIQEKLCFEISYNQLVVYEISVSKGLEKTIFDLSQTFSWKNQILKKVENQEKNKLKNMITIDADKVKGDLYLRTRLKGDSFIPLGMKGHKKIKDFMIDLKIPVYKRDEILLLCDETSIVWLIGYRMNDCYKVTDKTQNKLSFKHEWL
jgi:tRNA(Ile)-lysidine synthase